MLCVIQMLWNHCYSVYVVTNIVAKFDKAIDNSDDTNRHITKLILFHLILLEKDKFSKLELSKLEST